MVWRTAFAAQVRLLIKNNLYPNSRKGTLCFTGSCLNQQTNPVSIENTGFVLVAEAGFETTTFGL